MKQSLKALALYILIACAVTYPLIFRMNSTVYGIYDHISTDLFACMHMYFWWPSYALTHNCSLLVTPLMNYPWGERVLFANATGFVMAPVSLLMGHIFAYNLTVLLNLILSAFGMFLLVRHITKSGYAGFIAGIVYGFCTNMLVRSYTTFDSTQIQWIPLYALYLIKYYQFHSWRNAILSGVFLLCNVLFAMPYYLVWLPILTAILLIACTGANIFNFHKVTRIGAVFAVVFALFIAYYFGIVGGTGTYAGAKPWENKDLAALSLKPLDYVIQHPRQLIAPNRVKELYWDAVKRPERNSDSNVAFVGFTALALATLVMWKGKGRIRWFFLAVALIAFWSTLTPYSPSGLILKYAPFARRILLYKAFVQFGVAGLSGMGAAWLMKRTKRKALFTAALSLLMLAEYSITPPALSVDLTETPGVYECIKALPADSVILELPLNRVNGNMYQGYVYYQTFHKKALFNSNYGARKIPDLETLKRQGVTHIVYHYHIGTKTVQFQARPIPFFDSGEVPGMRRIYTGPRQFSDTNKSPYDYGFADVYEITP